MNKAALIKPGKGGETGQCVGHMIAAGDGVEFSGLPAARLLHVRYSAEREQSLKIVLNGKDAGELPLKVTQGLMINQDARYKTVSLPLEIPAGASLALQTKEKVDANRGTVLVEISLE